MSVEFCGSNSPVRNLPCMPVLKVNLLKLEEKKKKKLEVLEDKSIARSCSLVVWCHYWTLVVWCHYWTCLSLTWNISSLNFAIGSIRRVKAVGYLPGQGMCSRKHLMRIDMKKQCNRNTQEHYMDDYTVDYSMWTLEFWSEGTSFNVNTRGYSIPLVSH